MEYSILLINNMDQTQRRLVRSSVPETGIFRHLVNLAQAEFRFRITPVRCLFPNNVSVRSDTPDDHILAALQDYARRTHDHGPIELVFMRGEDYKPDMPYNHGGTDGSGKYRVIVSQATVTGESYKQLKRCAKFDGMLLAVGMPNLHAGDSRSGDYGAPAGAVSITTGRLHPWLTGADIGCGMALHQLPLLVEEGDQAALLARRLNGLEGQYHFTDECSEADFLRAHGIAPGLPGGHDSEPGSTGTLGTLGREGHFVEILKIVEIRAEAAFALLGLDADLLLLLVHAGSRELGQRVSARAMGGYWTKFLVQDTPEASEYLDEHDQAVRWAKANRALIAKRVMHALGDHIEANSKMIIESCHNWVERCTVPTSMLEDGGQGEQTVWIHRKGATSTLRGAVVISGSRGARSYIVMPTGDGIRNAFSLAHSAGRCISRTAARAKFSDPYYADKLYTTEFGSEVVCDNLDLLYEEAPPAFKDVEAVVEDLVATGACQVVAVMEPVVTYKCRENSK